MKNLQSINGVTPSRVYLPDGPYDTILDFLEKRFPRGTRLGWERRMLSGKVFNQAGQPIRPCDPYLARTLVYYYREVQENFVIPFEEKIVFEDEFLLVSDKPHFLPVTPVGPYIQETLLVRLRNRTGIETLSCMHRLDLETAGLVMFTKKPETRDQYAGIFRQKKIQKTYQAIAPLSKTHSWPKLYQSRIEKAVQFMQMHELSGVANSSTMIELVDAHGDYGLYQLKPTTGKKHQLRLHMSNLGIPILYDQIYPQIAAYVPPDKRDYSKPLQLLAKSLEFVDPITNEIRFFESGLKLQWPFRQDYV
jgi:tRNA pseudouridine32 synthase/23S rRNA pseudouridine746 synthase